MNRFWIFPQERPFLPDIKAFIQSLSQGAGSRKSGRAVLIVPNNRPKRYLRHLYAQERAALPHVFTLAEIAEIWSANGEEALRMAGPLDQAALAQECLKQLGRDDSAVARLADMDTALFLPWGLRLAGVLDELLRQDVQAKDIIHAEAEVSPTAAALLGALGRIAQVWRAALTANGQTTPGLTYALAAQAARSAASLPRHFAPSPDRPVLIAGFHLLTGTEDALLHRLWQEGAHICLHSDIGLVQGSKIHWACEEHKNWLARWKARPVSGLSQLAGLVDSPDPAFKAAGPRYYFFAGYDCHSQLEMLREKLQDPRYASSTAVALPDSSLLMPVLHHLPDKEVNISMGYPLRRSSLCRLAEDLFQLTERAQENRPYWSDLRRVLRNPCLNMLCLPSDKTERIFLREGLRRMESLLLEGERFVDMADLWAQCRALLPAPDCAALEQIFDAVLHPLEKASTTADIAGWLRGMCLMLLQYGGDMWSHFPLESEALNRMLKNVVPQLDETRLRAGVFPRVALHNIARHILHAERVPFDAEPLSGLQVIGMLETRLLHFQHVFILEATDDRLPGATPPDPLLPDSLRAALGLPDAREHARATAHTLYRLCAGAEEVHFFWQEGSGELSEGKKYRSRFVEQLLWEEEQRLGRIINPNEPPLVTASLPELRMPVRTPKKLPLGPHLGRSLENFLNAPLTPTALDVYLRCPLAFAWERLYRITPAKVPNEGDDPPLVGDCLHKTLLALYKPWLHKRLLKGDISLDESVACFHKTAADMQLERRLPADAWLMLEAAIPHRLGLFLHHQPNSTRITALEKKFSVSLGLHGRAYTFKGVTDRLDYRGQHSEDEQEEGLRLLDYKTGNPKLPDSGLWTDNLFFGQVAALCEGHETEAKFAREQAALLLDQLRPRLPSLQLPCYLAMLQTAGQGVAEACLVPLGKDGREMPLFGGLYGAELDTALEYCRLALSLVLKNLSTTTEFAARPDKHCNWCAYAGLCGN